METKTKAAKTAPALGGAAIRRLRALGHHLDPIVSIGKDGLTDAVVAATAAALGKHELVKVRIQAEAAVEGRREVARELADKASAVLAQVLGRTFLLYKRHPKKPKIDLTVRRSAPAGAQAEGKGKTARRRR